MWAKVAEELAVPWRAAEAMHWQLGEADMARRAGVIPFSLAAVNNEAASSRSFAGRNQPPIQPQDASGLREMRPPSPPGYGRIMAPMTSARTSRRGHINPQQLPPQQHTRPMLPPQHLHQVPHPSPHAVMPGPPAPLQQQPPPPPPGPAVTLAHSLGEYRHSPGPGLAPIQPHPPSHNSGPLPGVAQLTTGMNPYGPQSGPPTPTSLPAMSNTSMPRYMPLEQMGNNKRRASPDMTRQDPAQRRRLA